MEYFIKSEGHEPVVGGSMIGMSTYTGFEFVGKPYSWAERFEKNVLGI